MSSPKVIDARFQQAVKEVGSLPKDGPVSVSQEDQLNFYGLFKQANEGDNTKPKPGMMDFAGKYKWNAWEGRKGMSQDDAKKKYVEDFIAILERHPSEETKAIVKRIDDAGKAAESS